MFSVPTVATSMARRTPNPLLNRSSSHPAQSRTGRNHQPSPTIAREFIPPKRHTSTKPFPRQRPHQWRHPPQNDTSKRPPKPTPILPEPRKPQHLPGPTGPDLELHPRSRKRPAPGPLHEGPIPQRDTPHDRHKALGRCVGTHQAKSHAGKEMGRRRQHQTPSPNPRGSSQPSLLQHLPLRTQRPDLPEVTRTTAQRLHNLLGRILSQRPGHP